jgi:hypothetical protein
MFMGKKIYTWYPYWSKCEKRQTKCCSNEEEYVSEGEKEKTMTIETLHV